MTREKRACFSAAISVISKLVSENTVSESTVRLNLSEFKALSKVEQEKVLHELFSDTCKYVNLCHELLELVSTLRNMIKFSEMCECYE